MLRSLFETARRQGKKPHEFFLVLLTKNTAQAQAALYRNPRVAERALRCVVESLRRFGKTPRYES